MSDPGESPTRRAARRTSWRTARPARLPGSSVSALHEIYREALRLGVYPYRYIRNMDILSAAEQLRLAESRVAVVGAGGLGGQVILLLARVGVGTLVVVDCDLFDETNLNRQALCVEETLGEPKARAAAEAVAAINPGVRVIPHQVRLNADVIDGILAGCDVVVDGLDNVPDRLLLQDAAGRLGIPMVHGALAGFEGRIMTVFPGDAGVKQLYGEAASGADPERPEAVLGVPAVTAALIGTFQAMEVLKILLKRGEPLPKRDGLCGSGEWPARAVPVWRIAGKEKITGGQHDAG